MPIPPRRGPGGAATTLNLATFHGRSAIRLYTRRLAVDGVVLPEAAARPAAAHLRRWPNEPTNPVFMFDDRAADAASTASMKRR